MDIRFAKFEDFLKNGDKSMQIEEIYLTKDAPTVIHAGEEEHTVCPVYAGYLDGKSGGWCPSNLALFGYYEEATQTFATEKELCILLFGDKIFKCPCSVKMIPLDGSLQEQYIISRLGMWRKNLDFDYIEPVALDEDIEEHAQELFCAGYRDVDLRRLLINIQNQESDDIDTLRLNGLHFALGYHAEAERAYEIIREKEELMFRREAAVKKRVKELVADDTDTSSSGYRLRSVYSVLLGLREKGAKSCTAVFGFGGNLVQVKLEIFLHPGYYIEGSRKKTRKFEQDYCRYIQKEFQPYSSLYREFIPYIVSLKVRGKEIYHAKPFK